MKRFLKEGKITCRVEKASVCLAVLSRFFTCYTQSQGLSRGNGLCEQCACCDSISVLSVKHVVCVLLCLSAASPSTHSDHERNGADHLQNEGDT